MPAIRGDSPGPCLGGTVRGHVPGVEASNTVNLAGYAVSRTVYDRVLGMEPRDGNGELLALYAMLDGARVQAAMLPAAATDEHPSLPLSAYVGSYRHPAFGAAEVSAHGGGLAVRFDSGARADAFKGVTDEFYLPVVDIRFRLGKSGVVEAFSLDLQQGAPAIRFVRSETDR